MEKILQCALVESLTGDAHALTRIAAFLVREVPLPPRANVVMQICFDKVGISRGSARIGANRRAARVTDVCALVAHPRSRRWCTATS